MTRSDNHRALEFVREFCGPVAPDLLVPQVIKGLFRLVPCDAAGCGTLDLTSGENSVVGSPPEYFAPDRNGRGIGLTEPHLRPRMHPGRFMRFSEFFSRREFHDSAMYCEHFRPLGVEDVMGMGFKDGADNFFTLERGRVFSDRDQEILNAVSGPLQSALTNARMLADLTERTGILEDALEVAGLNVLIVSAQGRIRFESPTARHLLVFYLGRDSYGDRLPDSVLRWMGASSVRLNQPSSSAGQSDPLYVVRSGRRLAIRMLLHPAGYMLVLEEEYEGANLTRLTELGLTRREAEVLSYIAMGKTGPEISIVLGISHDTVRKHTSTILEKLGVETRTAAAAIALERLQSAPRK